MNPMAEARSFPWRACDVCEQPDQCKADSRTCADQAQFSPQTLPAPGEVEAVAASASIALMYLQTGFIECPQCGEEVPTKDLDATHELATVVQPAPITGATTLATVAAANDEGVAEDLGRQVRIAAWNAAKKSGASDALGYAVVEAVVAEFAAIRLLSQGGGK